MTLKLPSRVHDLSRKLRKKNSFQWFSIFSIRILGSYFNMKKDEPNWLRNHSFEIMWWNKKYNWFYLFTQNLLFWFQRSLIRQHLTNFGWAVNFLIKHVYVKIIHSLINHFTLVCFLFSQWLFHKNHYWIDVINGFELWKLQPALDLNEACFDG